MSAVRTGTLFLSVLLLGVNATLAAQTPQLAPPVSQAPAYLLRMERLRPAKGVCVLVRGDGQYHVERLSSEDIDIFEGILSAQDLQTLFHMVNEGELLQLSQDKISTPMITSGLDEFDIAVLRPGHWQSLAFPAPESRKPHEQVVNPLLHWLEELEKQKHVSLPEDEARNNCLPPGEIALKTRTPPQQAQPATASPPETAPSATVPAYLFQLLRDTLTRRELERTCVIVYSDGRYHFERKTQSLGNTLVQTSIFEDAIPAAEVGHLREILDKPELVNHKYQELPSVLTMDADIIRLFVPRGASTQRLNFWRYFGAMRIGSGGMPDVHNQGMKVYQPLGDWFKTNIEQRKTAPTKAATATRCAAPTP